MPNVLGPLVAGVLLAAASSTAGAGVAPAHAAGSLRVSVGDVAVGEGNMSRRVAKIPVTLSYPPTTTVTVQYTTGGGTAFGALNTPGADYRPHTGTLTFLPGQTFKGIAVNIWADFAVEGDETFGVHLTNPSAGLALDRADGTGTILDDDSPSKLAVTVGDSTIAEPCGGKPKPTAVIPITLSRMGTSAVTVAVQTTAMSATPAADYVSQSKTFTFTSGQNLKELKVPVLADTTVEGTEQVSVTITSIVTSEGFVIGRANGTVTILDCDPSL